MFNFEFEFSFDFESDFEFNFEFNFRVRIRFQFRVHLNPILNPSVAFPTDNLISLSYSMPVFSANLFGLFSLHFILGKKLVMTWNF